MISNNSLSKGFLFLFFLFFAFIGNSAIYYVNDNDGDTILFKEKYVSGIVDTSKKTIDYSVEPTRGRILIFDGLTFHTGKIPSNNIKLLLNFNFV
jgi:hypothetical protein